MASSDDVGSSSTDAPLPRDGHGRGVWNLPSMVLSLVLNCLELCDFSSARRCCHYFQRVARLPLSSPMTIDLDGWARASASEDDDNKSRTLLFASLSFSKSWRLMGMLRRLELHMKHLRIATLDVPPFLVVGCFPWLRSLSIQPRNWNLEPLRALQHSLERLHLSGGWTEEPSRAMFTGSPSLLSESTIATLQSIATTTKAFSCLGKGSEGGAQVLQSLTNLRHLHCTYITTASTLQYLPSSLVSLRIDNCSPASPIALRALFSHAPSTATTTTTRSDDATPTTSTSSSAVSSELRSPTRLDRAVPVCFKRWPRLRRLTLLDVNMNMRTSRELGGWRDDVAVLLAVAPRLESFACESLYLPQCDDPSRWDPFDVCPCYKRDDARLSTSTSRELFKKHEVPLGVPGGESMWVERLDLDVDYHSSDSSNDESVWTRLTSLTCAPGSWKMLQYMSTGSLLEEPLFGKTMTTTTTSSRPYGRRLVPDQMTSICFSAVRPFHGVRGRVADWLQVNPALTRHLSTDWASSLRQLSLALVACNWSPGKFDRLVTSIGPSKMPKLVALGLDCGHLSDLSPLATLTTITSLNLSMCTHVTQLPTMPNLCLLALPQTPLLLLNLKDMASLTTLWLPEQASVVEALHSLTLPANDAFERLDMSRCFNHESSIPLSGSAPSTKDDDNALPLPRWIDLQVDRLAHVFSRVKVALYVTGVMGNWSRVWKAASERYGFRYYISSSIPFYDYNCDPVYNSDLIVKDDCEPWSPR